MFVFYTDGGPTRSNVAGSCSVALDRSAVAYDITFQLRFDETFTPAVISAIDAFRVSSFQVTNIGTITSGKPTTRLDRLGSNVDHGPFILNFVYDNFNYLANGLGYNFTVSTPYVHTYNASYHTIIP